MTELVRLGAQHVAAEVRGKAAAFTNYLIAYAASDGDQAEAASMFRHRWPNSVHGAAVGVMRSKAAVPAGDHTTTGWAAELAPLRPLAEAYVETLRPRTALGRMTGYRPVPLGIKFPRATTGSTARFVGPGRALSMTRMSLETVELSDSKVGALSVFSVELARLSDPAIEQMLARDISAAIAAAIDSALLDPTSAATADQPASITYGATEITASGSSLATFSADMKRLFSAISSNLISPYLIMRPTTAVEIAALVTAAGGTVTLGAQGGEWWGVPVLTTASAPSDGNSPGDDVITLLDASELMVGEGGINFRVARHANIQLSDSPDSPPTASTVMVSLFQLNLIGLLVTRTIRWQMRRSGAVAYLSGLNL